MSQITIKIAFIAGTIIETAIEEARTLADTLNLAYTTFSFNKVKFSIGKNADVKEAITDFHVALASDDPMMKFVIYY